MLIDTHCHLDQLDAPEKVARHCEETGIRVVAVTNLPSHYAISADRLRGFRFVHAALGLHPLAAEHAARETDSFRRLAPHANWIGEIGLDFSDKGNATRDIQVRMFEEVLRAIADRPRFVTLHSRGAEKEVLDALERHRIKGAVFHWYTGGAAELVRLISLGHYVSVNPAMLTSASGKRVMELAPPDRILAETDAPHTKISARTTRPDDVQSVYQSLATRWNLPLEEVAKRIAANFDRIVGSTAQ